MKDYTLANAAYDGYCVSSNNKSLISGQTLPPFCDLPYSIKDAWHMAAKVVRMAVIYDCAKQLEYFAGRVNSE